MARTNKSEKKLPISNSIHAIKNSTNLLQEKFAEKKNIIQHLMHPDYILFDWEFFSRELEFE